MPSDPEMCGGAKPIGPRMGTDENTTTIYYILPKSRIPSTTILVPAAINKISVATRT